MKKPDIRQAIQSGGFVICAFLALQLADGLEGTEFSGGWLTGPLLSMADIGTVLFILAFILAVPASCGRNWSCFVLTLFAARLLSYCSGSLRSCLCWRARVQSSASSGIALEYVASDRLNCPSCCHLHLHLPPHDQLSDASPRGKYFYVVTVPKSLITAVTRLYRW